MNLRCATAALVAACAAACAHPPETRAAEEGRTRQMSPLGLLPATFTGNVAGQAWQLDLLAMGRWQLRRGATDSLGGYALEGERLSLQRPGEPSIELRLRPDGNLRAAGGAVLQRQANAAPFEPRLALAGWFTFFADAPRFVVCADGRSLPVHRAGDYPALERAYAAAQPPPGAPVWARVEGLIAPRPAIEAGQVPVETLTVLRLDRIDARARCEGLRADRPLTGAEWSLAWLAGPAAAPARAVLRFDGTRVRGNDGCNRIAGPAVVAGATLRFGPLVATEMACLQGMAEAAAFSAALARVRRWQVRGEALELLDVDGQPLARLLAGR